MFGICVARVRCDARGLVSPGEIRAFAHTHTHKRTNSCPNWRQIVEQRNKHFVRGWLVGWLLQSIGPMMSWWVMCRICSTSAVVKTKGAVKFLQTSGWIMWTADSKLSFAMHVMLISWKILACTYKLDWDLLFCWCFGKILIIHPVNSQFSWGNRSSFNFFWRFPSPSELSKSVGDVFPLLPPVRANCSMPWNEHKRRWTQGASKTTSAKSLGDNKKNRLVVKYYIRSEMILRCSPS